MNIHDLVEYVDGSVLGQLVSADICTPIAHALAWQQRVSSGVDFLALIWTARSTSARRTVRSPSAWALAQAVARNCGLEPATVNAANEVVVQAFLDRRLNFAEIPGGS